MFFVFSYPNLALNTSSSALFSEMCHSGSLFTVRISHKAQRQLPDLLKMLHVDIPAALFLLLKPRGCFCSTVVWCQLALQSFSSTAGNPNQEAFKYWRPWQQSLQAETGGDYSCITHYVQVTIKEVFKEKNSAYLAAQCWSEKFQDRGRYRGCTCYHYTHSSTHGFLQVN